jgi:RimJ/RimL family protein N-acetyltransferase
MTESDPERMRLVATERLALEPQVAAHAEEMFLVLGDPAIYEYENEPPPSLEWLRDRFTRLETRRSADGRERWLNWVVRLRGDGLIGFVQATVDPNGGASIAYILSSRHWGRGYAHEAVRSMTDELVGRYGVRRLYAVFKTANDRSRRLLERLGFTPAAPGPHAGIDVEPHESLMTRDAAATEPSRDPFAPMGPKE